MSSEENTDRLSSDNNLDKKLHLEQAVDGLLSAIDNRITAVKETTTKYREAGVFSPEQETFISIYLARSAHRVFQQFILPAIKINLTSNALKTDQLLPDKDALVKIDESLMFSGEFTHLKRLQAEQEGLSDPIDSFIEGIVGQHPDLEQLVFNCYENRGNADTVEFYKLTMNLFYWQSDSPPFSLNQPSLYLFNRYVDKEKKVGPQFPRYVIPGMWFIWYKMLLADTRLSTSQQEYVYTMMVNTAEDFCDVYWYEKFHHLPETIKNQLVLNCPSVCQWMRSVADTFGVLSSFFLEVIPKTSEQKKLPDNKL